VSAASFLATTVVGVTVAIHELGHAALAVVVYEKAKPKIQLFLGRTFIDRSTLSPIGRFLGKSVSEAALSATVFAFK
jgi:hypothetical protein